jgi:CheY-like chemotaxis protein
MPRRGRVLVAEDDQDVVALLRRILVNAGFDVTTVRDGLAAVVRAIEILPDLIILDVNMPKMGASEVLPQLKGNPGTREIPVVVITGTVPDARPYFIEAGAADFFIKPFDQEALLGRLIDLGKRANSGTSGRR